MILLVQLTLVTLSKGLKPQMEAAAVIFFVGIWCCGLNY